MRKRLISIFLVICVSVSVFSVPALAGSLDASAAAYDLYSLGLFKGTDAGFELSRTPTRLEALIMAIRVLGKEKTALNGDWDCPFTDVPLWAEDYVGYGWQKGLTNGCSATVFGSGDEISGAAFVSLMLRALGYSDKKGDFSWTSPWALAEAAGISDGRYNDSTRITRGDVAIICDFALDVIPKNGDITLREQLQLASKAAPSALSANEISRRCSSAVFYPGV